MFPAASLVERLAYGELSGVVTLPEEDRAVIHPTSATSFLPILDVARITAHPKETQK